MTELVLGLSRQNAEGFREAIGNEKRIISETSRSHFFREQPAFDTAVRDVQDFAISRENHAALKASVEASVLRLLGEFGFQFRAVVCGIGGLSCIACAAHTGRTVQHIHLKTGIIRQHQQAGYTTAAAHSFDDGIGLEGVARFFIKRHARMGAKIFNLPFLSKDGGDFFSLVGIGGGEDESGHN